MLGPKDTAPIAAAWTEQLDRYGIGPDSYQQIFEKALDTRLNRIRAGERAPEFTVELLISAGKPVAKWSHEIV